MCVRFDAYEEAPIYDNGGMLQSMKAANGIVTSFDFDKNGRLKQLSYNNQDSIIKRYNYQYDAANNIRFKNEDEFRYDQLNQLIFAGLKGQFEADTQIEEQQVGRIVKDFKGQLPLEFQINQLDIMELDYAAGSIGVDLQVPAAITRIQLTPQSPLHRVTEADSLGVFISNDNTTYTPVANWSLKTEADGVLEIVLSTPVTARYLKIKSYYDNRDLQFGFVNKAEFVNAAREIIKVYYQVDYRQEDYTYDAIGNRKTETVTQGNAVIRFYEYYPNSSRLKSNEKYNFVYDNNGNLVKKTAVDGSVTWEYHYDLLNRLLKVSKNGTDIASYIYDESGLRLKKQRAGKTVYYVFDTGGNVLYEQENREYLEYVYVLGKHFARIDGNLDNLEDRTKYFYHTDHLGSTVAVTDEAGQTVWSGEYTPFGGKHSVNGELAKAAKFTGKDLDEDTELYYFNARWYDQEVGRFISEDPIGDPNNPNLYVYGRNNPLIIIDPTGKTTFFVIFYNNSDSDPDQSFKKAAETWKEEIENSKEFDKNKDTVILIGVNSEKDFKEAWETVYKKTEQRVREGGEEQKIQEGVIFSHSSIDGLHFALDDSPENGTLMHYEIEDLKQLQWKDQGTLILKGCNSGVEEEGVSLAKTFAINQKTTTSGQTGYAYFSSDPDFYKKINKDSKNVYLHAYLRGRNSMWAQLFLALHPAMKEATYDSEGNLIDNKNKNR